VALRRATDIAADKTGSSVPLGRGEHPLNRRLHQLLRTVQRSLRWNERSRGTRPVKRICGVLLIIAGIMFFFSR